MRLVDDEQRDAGGPQRLDDLVVGQLLGGEEHVLGAAVAQLLPRPAGLRRPLRGVDHHGVGRLGVGEALALVALQGDQRGDDHRRAVQQQGGHLVDRRLAGAGGQHGEHVAAVGERLHRRQLLGAQLRPAERLLGDAGQLVPCPVPDGRASCRCTHGARATPGARDSTRSSPNSARTSRFASSSSFRGRHVGRIPTPTGVPARVTGTASGHEEYPTGGKNATESSSRRSVVWLPRARATTSVMPTALPDARLVNVLVWHVHGSWTTAFVQGRHRYLLPTLPERGPWGGGRPAAWDWPAVRGRVLARRTGRRGRRRRRAAAPRRDRARRTLAGPAPRPRRGGGVPRAQRPARRAGGEQPAPDGRPRRPAARARHALQRPDVGHRDHPDDRRRARHRRPRAPLHRRARGGGRVRQRAGPAGPGDRHGPAAAVRPRPCRSTSSGWARTGWARTWAARTCARSATCRSTACTTRWPGGGCTCIRCGGPRWGCRCWRPCTWGCRWSRWRPPRRTRRCRRAPGSAPRTSNGWCASCACWSPSRSGRGPWARPAGRTCCAGTASTGS